MKNKKLFHQLIHYKLVAQKKVLQCFGDNLLRNGNISSNQVEWYDH
jgi:hypothetical protein